MRVDCEFYREHYETERPFSFLMCFFAKRVRQQFLRKMGVRRVDCNWEPESFFPHGAEREEPGHLPAETRNGHNMSILLRDERNKRFFAGKQRGEELPVPLVADTAKVAELIKFLNIR